jgi:hypothetical protein
VFHPLADSLLHSESFDTLVAMWTNSLFHVERYLSCSQIYDFYTNKRAALFESDTGPPLTTSTIPGQGDNDQDEELEETSKENKRGKMSLHHAISCTYLLSAMISFHERQFHSKNLRQQNREKERKERGNHTHTAHSPVVICGLCGSEGIFLEKKVTLPTPSLHLTVSQGADFQSQRRKMMRCSRCKRTYYCCKEHQQEHWKTHRVNKSLPLDSSSPVVLVDNLSQERGPATEPRGEEKRLPRL